MGAAMQQCRIVILPVQKLGMLRGLEEGCGRARAAVVFIKSRSRQKVFERTIERLATWMRIGRRSEFGIEETDASDSESGAVKGGAGAAGSGAALV